MKVAVVLDNKVNKWALQRFEPLNDILDITVFVGENNDYDVGSIKVKKHFLKHREEAILAAREPSMVYKRIIKAPNKKMDFYYFSLKKYLNGFDIVYSCDLMRSAYTIASLKEMLGFKFILSWWENIPYRAEFDQKSSYQKGLIMDRVDMFLPFTEKAAQVLRLEGVPEDRLTVVYPGVDLKRFTPGPKQVKMMAQNDVDPGSFIILYVGKLASWKGVHNLAYAARILKSRGLKGFLFVIAGKGAQKENLQRLISVADVGEHFRFLDFISYDRMPEVYRMADLLVLPSYPVMTWQEQFGMVLVEAMATGVPVISTMSGSIPEVVGDAGVLVPPGDFFALADAINAFMKDKVLLLRLGRLAMSRARERFDASIKSAEIQRVCLGAGSEG